MPPRPRQVSKAVVSAAQHEASRKLLKLRSGYRIHSCEGAILGPQGIKIPPCKYLTLCSALDPLQEVKCELSDMEAGRIARKHGWDFLAVEDPPEQVDDDE